MTTKVELAKNAVKEAFTLITELEKQLEIARDNHQKAIEVYNEEVNIQKINEENEAKKNKDYVKPLQASQELKVSVHSLRKMAEDGKIDHIKLGDKIFYNLVSITSQFIKPSEASKILGISIHGLRKLASEGKINHMITTDDKITYDVSSFKREKLTKESVAFNDSSIKVGMTGISLHEDTIDCEIEKEIDKKPCVVDESINKQPKKKKSIPKAIRMKLWEKMIGNVLIGSCFVCEREIKIDSFEAGHIISEKNGGEIHIDNLLPICKPCNGSCGTMNLYDFKKSLTVSKNPVEQFKPNNDLAALFDFKVKI